jgi:uncharacterized protein YycO
MFPKYLVYFFCFYCICFFSNCSSNSKTHGGVNTFQTGDIIFQTSQSSQCKAVQLATHSIYSHCGILYKTENELVVYEAIGPVKLTPFNEWIKHGKDEKYVVRRLKNSSTLLTPAILKKMEEVGKQFAGKEYDIYFGWNNDRIYCSELVWKIYKEAAQLEVGKLQQLKEFDLTSEPVKEKLRERYGNKIPLEDTVISPQRIFESNLLETIADE